MPRAAKKVQAEAEAVLEQVPTSLAQVLPEYVEEEHVSGQARLIASLRALRYVKSLGGDRAQVIMARRMLREGLARCIHVPLELALDPNVEAGDRLRAVELLAKFGLGMTVDRTPLGAGDNTAPGVLLLPTLDAIEAAAEDARARIRQAEDEAALADHMDAGDIEGVTP
jgi:hypothetical protein